MPTPIGPISPAAIQPVRLPAAAPASSSAAEASHADTFQNVLSDAVQRVEQFRQTADVAAQRFLSGEDEELHKVAIATQQAELSFELFLQMKNKVVQAYQEIMRMQI